MAKSIIYTIGREFGSGGRKVGSMLAEKLGIPFYDKELLELAAKESGFNEELFKKADEKPNKFFFYSSVMANYPVANTMLGYNELSLNDQLFLIQSQTIRNLAEKGPCVIIGRCADYVLRDRDDAISIFITADLESRTERAIKVYEVDEKKARDVCIKSDKNRASYYNSFTDGKWGFASNYDLTLDSASIGLKGCVKQIISFGDIYAEYLKEEKSIH